MRFSTVLAPIPALLGLAAADFRLWSNDCQPILGNIYEQYRAAHKGPCTGTLWEDFGEDEMSSKNPCNKAETFEYKRTDDSDEYDLFLNSKKVGRCFPMREQTDCRYGIDACIATAFYNCKTPVCNSWND